MGQIVCAGAELKCSCGNAKCLLNVLPVNRVMTSKPVANIMDHIPLLNILPFGMCTASSNPAVMTAMGAPAPCIPVTPSPWVAGSPTVMVANFPALNITSKLTCAYLGVIEVTNAGQETVEVP